MVCRTLALRVRGCTVLVHTSPGQQQGRQQRAVLPTPTGSCLVQHPPRAAASLARVLGVARASSEQRGPATHRL